MNFILKFIKPIQREVWNNQLKRQSEDGRRLQEELEIANKNRQELSTQLRESDRR